MKKGFTLIEVVIVITIVVVLAVIALVLLRNQIFKGQDARRKADIERIRTAAEEYERDHNCYPLPSLLACKPGTGLQPYLNKISCDPVTGGSYLYVIQDSSCPGWFKIYTILGNSADVSVINGIGPNNAFNFVQGSANAPVDIGTSPTISPASSGSTSTPAPAPTSGGGSQSPSFYGCRGGICVPIGWDLSRPGPECDPNYQNSFCYNQCGPSVVECKPWH